MSSTHSQCLTIYLTPLGNISKCLPGSLSHKMLTTSYQVEQIKADPKLPQVPRFVLKWALYSDTTPEIYACWKINKITHSTQDLVFICVGLQISGSSVGLMPVGQ